MFACTLICHHFSLVFLNTYNFNVRTYKMCSNITNKPNPLVYHIFENELRTSDYSLCRIAVIKRYRVSGHATHWFYCGTIIIKRMYCRYVRILVFSHLHLLNNCLTMKNTANLYFSSEVRTYLLSVLVNIVYMS